MRNWIPLEKSTSHYRILTAGEIMCCSVWFRTSFHCKNAGFAIEFAVGIMQGNSFSHMWDVFLSGCEFCFGFALKRISPVWSLCEIYFSLSVKLVWNLFRIQCEAYGKSISHSVWSLREIDFAFSVKLTWNRFLTNWISHSMRILPGNIFSQSMGSLRRNVFRIQRSLREIDFSPACEAHVKPASQYMWPVRQS
jgi:hypothetical protein